MVQKIPVKETMTVSTEPARRRSTSLIDTSLIDTSREKQLILPHVQSISNQTVVSTSVTSQALTVSSNERDTTKKLGMPITLLEANLGKSTNQSTAPVRVSVAPKQMSVLISKPQTLVAKAVPIMAKTASGVANTQKSTGVSKISTKPVPRSVLVPVTQGIGVTNQNVLTVNIPANTSGTGLNAPSSQNASNSVLLIQQPKQTESKVIAALVSPVERSLISDSGVKVPQIALTAATYAPISGTSLPTCNTLSATGTQGPVEVDVAEHTIRLKVEPLSANTSPTGNEQAVPSSTQLKQVISAVQPANSPTHIQNSELDEKKSKVPENGTVNLLQASTPRPAEPNITNDAPTPNKTDTAAENLQDSAMESAEENGLCCDDQDCGVTVMPGKYNHHSHFGAIHFASYQLASFTCLCF